MTIQRQDIQELISHYFQDNSFLEDHLNTYLSDETLSILSKETDFDHFLKALVICLEKLSQKKASDWLKSDFLSKYCRYVSGFSGKISLKNITPLEPDDLIDYTTLTSSHFQLGKSHMNHVAVIKLNGGLGTSMGCSGPKSLINVTSSDTFLDLIRKQIEYLRNKNQVKLPFLLMNSIHTQEETKQVVNSMKDCFLFMQHEIPRICKNSFLPLSIPDSPDQEWCPPGHGDLFLSLYESGYLESLIEQGITHIFVSNIDNLGAQFDLSILGYMIQHNLDFIMETTPKTKADVKGGTLIRYQDRLTLLERAQVEDDFLSEFEDMQRFKVFNTNNVWIRLDSIKDNLRSLVMDLPLIVNAKSVQGNQVVQLEAAMGAAVGLFKRSCSIVVPRSRFIPVKQTTDLLVLQSDIVEKDEHGFCVYNTQENLPIIEWDNGYKTVDEFHHRFKVVPSLKEATFLSLKGDITFGPNVVIKGRVQVNVMENESYVIENETLENCLMTIRHGKKDLQPLDKGQ